MNTNTLEKAKRMADAHAKATGHDCKVVQGDYAYYIGQYPNADASRVVYVGRAPVQEGAP